MKNRKIILIFSLLLITFVLFGGACKCNKEKPIEPTLTMPTKELILNKEEMSILLGESDYLLVEAVGMDANTPITFTSSNESVATVDNIGVIQALNVGTSTITVKADGVEETCLVSVTLGKYLPEISLKQIDGSEAVIGIDGAINFEPVVIFNHKEYYDATYEYEVVDKAIGTVNNNVFTATGKTGDTLITIYATWRGQSGKTMVTLQKTIKVTVSVPILELYTRANFEGEEYPTSADILALIDDANATDVQTNVTAGSDVINISNNIITVNKYGSASVTITYKDADLQPQEKKFDILAQRPVVEYEDSFNFSIKDGYIPVSTIWGSAVTVKEAYLGTPILKGEEITIEEGKFVEGISLKGNVSEQKTVTLLTDTEGYTVNINVYTHLIDDSNDLISTFALKDKDVAGAYLVTQDIDASALDVIIHDDLYNAETGGGAKKGFAYAFKGTFDGGGHTVIVNVSNCGLFGMLEKASIINTNFVLNIGGITNGYGYNPTGLAYYATDTTISNVYAELNANSGLTAANSRTWALSLISNLPTLTEGYIKLENVVVVNNDDFTNLSANTEKHWVSGALFYNDNGRKSAASRSQYMQNVFVVAPEKLGNGYYVPMAGGTTQQVFAINDTTGKADATEKTGVTQFAYDNVTRYATIEALCESNKLSTLPAYMAQKIIKDALVLEVNGIVANGGAELESGVLTPINLKVGETDLSDLRLKSSNETIAIIEGSSVKMISFGMVTITATGTVFGVEVTTTFNVVLSLQAFNEEQLFSGLDGTVDMKTIFGEDVTLLNAYSTEGETYTVVDGKITDLTNDTNEAFTKSIILETTTHKFKKATFKVYTKLIDDAGDLAVFSLTQNTVANIVGCYLVTKDIDASAVTANAHTDIREGDWNFNYAFKGMFDGNGKTIIANADKGGLFGVLNGATVTNANFVFNLTGSRRVNTDKWPVGLAYQAVNSKISNVYAELNASSGLSTASRAWALAFITTTDKTLEMSNVVVINNDDFSGLTPESANWIGGALFYTDGARADVASHNAKMNNVFVIAPERCGTSGLYVPMAGGSKQQIFASNDTTGVADANAKTGSAQAVYTGVTRYTDTASFKASAAWAGIPDFIKTAVNANINN